ncbi:MAG: thrombospondin type 3 repeat-containing protein, partial [Bacteroidota bacterium]
MYRYALPLAFFMVVLTFPALAQNPDTDNDGIPDAVERELGTDPAYSEQLQQIATDKTKDQGDSVGPTNYSPGLDLVAVSLGNVAGNRYLWRVDFLGPFEPANSRLILYVDADADPKTGRRGLGCEYMVLNLQGVPAIRAFSADGKETAEGLRVAVVGKSVYLCSDFTFKQVEGKAVGTFRLVHEIAQPFSTMDGIGHTAFAIPGDSTR